ncbi:MAG: flagellar basal body rod protein FlgB, partial [Desulfovibrio sp.]|nr:flagellar basal body rod protein FlgB [Desulfovibrio sp.]
MKTMFPDNVALVGKVLDLHLERQNVVMSNLANMDIPAYKAKRLDFEAELQKAVGEDAQGKLTRTASDHLPSVFDAASFQGEMFQQWKPR